MAVLISYALAGPQAYADLLQIEDYHVLIVPYTLIYTLFILLSGDYIKPIISILTILKMLALICVLFAVSVVADLIIIEQPPVLNSSIITSNYYNTRSSRTIIINNNNIIILFFFTKIFLWYFLY